MTKKAKERISCFLDGMTAFVFGAVLIVFCIAHFALPDADFSPVENRMLSRVPQLSVRSVLDRTFERDFESYISDQFPLRSDWISLKTVAERRLLLRNEIKGVYFSDSGWLIESHSGIFSSKTAEQNRDALIAFAQEYAPQFQPGHFSVLIAPNAVDVLSEKLPRHAPQPDGRAYCAEIASRLPDGASCAVFPALCAHSQEYLYFRTDHHWTMRAAFYAYQEYARKIGVAVPEISDYEISSATNSFEGTVQSKFCVPCISDSIEVFFPKKSVSARMQTNDMEWRNLFDEEPLLTKDKYAYFLGGNAPLVKIVSDAQGKRRLLVIKDSYANCFVPFLAESFSQIDVLDVRYARQSVRELISRGGYTDLLVLYNAAGFASDKSILRLLQ